MKRMNIHIPGKRIIKWSGWIAAGLLLGACSKVLNKLPENNLASSQMYRNVYDADAAIIGLYGKFMGLAKQYVVLNELRGDLMEVTDNADGYLREINQHRVSDGNPYANPRPFYEVINDCNDILKNFNIMLTSNKMKAAEYQQRYSDVGCLRSWCYLQLGIHWGKVPYVTDPLESVDAVKDPAKFRALEFKELLDSLAAFTGGLPFMSPYPIGATVNTGLMTTVDGTSTKRFFIDKYSLAGDIFLWRGNYTTADSCYRLLMEHTGYDLDNPNSLYSGGDQYFTEFRQAWASVTDNHDMNVGYVRYHEMDINSLIDNNSWGWRSMFARGIDQYYLTQWLWVLPYNSNFAPTNPFVDLFSNRGGSYLVKPSQVALDNWNSQTQFNGFPYDARGKFTVRTMDGQPVIVKYLYGYLDGTSFLPVNILSKNGQWFLNRAAAVHLRFAEGANRDRHSRLAAGLLNGGLRDAYGDGNPDLNRDVSNIEHTNYLDFPYNFDARYGEFPRYRAPWYKNTGIRGTAYLKSIPFPAGDSTIAVEDAILNEAGLELAYEGYRWADLLRITLRRNDPSILANAIYNKLSKDNMPGASEAKANLLARKWYLPFKW